MSDIEPFELESYNEFDRTYWAGLSISVGELTDAGVINETWFCTFDYFDEEQAHRLWQKFLGRYQFRELGMLPPGRWKLRCIALLNELMPKYKYLYQAIADGASPMMASDEYHKGRDVYSAFPQTALGGSNQDYASSGNDREYETIRDYGLMELSERIDRYNDVDVLILNELDKLFMAITTTSIPWM